LGRNILYYSSYSPFSDKANLTSLTIGSSVTTIGYGAFSGCENLTGTLIIPNSVTSIGNSAFYGCGSLDLSKTLTLSIGSAVTSIGSSAFYGCSTIKSLTIPSSVTTVGTNAFYGCSGLKTVTLEDGTKSLTFDDAVNHGNGTNGKTFANCPITSLHLGRNILYYSSYSPFRDKASLTSLTIGNSVTTIGNSAFSGCTSLSQITSNPTTPPTISSNTFSGVGTGILIKINCTYLNAYKTANYWKLFTNYDCKTDIKDVDLPNFKIYPNPAKDLIHLSGITELGNVQILDLAGRVVETRRATALRNDDAQTIYFSALPQGIYFLKAGMQTVKFVKE
jgi:hypothetical protein